MKSITQRRIFSLLLSLAMLIGLLPALGSIASAAGSGTTEGDPRIVTTYAELSSALSSGVTYVKLGANINTKDFNDGAGYNKSIQQTGTVQLDLNGYSVTFFSRTSPLPAAIRVTGDLSVKDSRGGGKLYIDANPNTASSKQVLILAETGSFTLNSGRIGVDNGLAKNSIVVVEGKGDAKVVFNGTSSGRGGSPPRCATAGSARPAPARPAAADGCPRSGSGCGRAHCRPSGRTARRA